jgi:RNA polymerase sigma-70 factor (ECF subfamily)
MPTKSDQQLISDYLKKGDQQALEILVKKYLKPVYNFVYRFVGDSKEAEDITQEVFIKMWRNLHQFSPERSLAPHRTGGSGSGFKTWLFVIAKNTAIDWLKKKKSLPFSSFENEKGENYLLAGFASSDLLPDELFSRSESRAKLALATESLASRYKTVLSLRYNSQFNFREIAEKLGESLNTVKSRHRRALIKLRGLLDKLY